MARPPMSDRDILGLIRHRSSSWPSRDLKDTRLNEVVMNAPMSLIVCCAISSTVWAMSSQNFKDRVDERYPGDPVVAQLVDEAVVVALGQRGQAQGHDRRHIMQDLAEQPLAR
jgi:hypothetical protein